MIVLKLKYQNWGSIFEIFIERTIHIPIHPTFSAFQTFRIVLTYYMLMGVCVVSLQYKIIFSTRYNNVMSDLILRNNTASQLEALQFMAMFPYILLFYQHQKIFVLNCNYKYQEIHLHNSVSKIMHRLRSHNFFSSNKSRVVNNYERTIIVCGYELNNIKYGILAQCQVFLYF